MSQQIPKRASNKYQRIPNKYKTISNIFKRVPQGSNENYISQQVSKQSQTCLNTFQKQFHKVSNSFKATQRYPSKFQSSFKLVSHSFKRSLSTVSTIAQQWQTNDATMTHNGRLFKTFQKVTNVNPKLSPRLCRMPMDDFLNIRKSPQAANWG